MQHLSTEFNVECALALTEIIQYQQLIYSYCEQNEIMDYRQNENEVKLFKTLEFDENIPKSDIIYGDGFDFMSMDRNMFYDCCKRKALLLYEKYIKSGSDLEIMIDYETQKVLMNLMQNKHIEWMQIEMKEINLIELMYLFETVGNEMYILMIDSYQRFVETSNYQKLRDCIFV